MAIAFVAAEAATNTAAPGRAGNGDITVTFPSGYTPTAGHLALIVLYNDAGSGSVPSNWTQVSGSPWGGGTPKLQCFYKVLAGGQGSAVTTISGSSGTLSHCAAMMIYSGVDPTTPVETVGTPSNGTGTPMTAGSIDPTTDNAVVIGLCGRGDNESSSGQTFGGSSTGVTERLDAGTNAGDDSQVSAYDKTIASGEGQRIGDDVRDGTVKMLALSFLLLIGVALLASIAAGLFAAFEASQIAPTFHDLRSLREATKRPVLGSVSMLQSPARTVLRRRRNWFFAGGISGLLAMFAAVTAYSLFLWRMAV